MSRPRTKLFQLGQNLRTEKSVAKDKALNAQGLPQLFRQLFSKYIFRNFDFGPSMFVSIELLRPLTSSAAINNKSQVNVVK